MRWGVRLGVDVGSVRVGLARCDPDGLLATPVETLQRGAGDLDAIAAHAEELEAVEIVVGLPVALDGTEGPAARAARGYAAALDETLATRGNRVPLRLVDERMTTAAATQGLRSAGRDARRGRSVIDQAAAVEILQGALDTERATGRPAGRALRRGRGRRPRTAPAPTTTRDDEDRR